MGAGALAWYLYPKGPKPETFKEEYSITLKDYAGNDVRLSDFKRKPLVVFMWASWCPYCAAEIGNLAQLKKTYGDQINTVAVNRAEPQQVAEPYTNALTQKEGILFLLDANDALFKSIQGYAMPETIFIDKGGTVTYHQRGPLKLEEAEGYLKTLISQ